MPPTRDELDDFGFARNSSQNLGFRNPRLGNSRNNDPSLDKDLFPGLAASSSHVSRPPTRSRMSRPGSSRDNFKELSKASDSYPLSSEASFSEGNFYNKLDLGHSNPAASAVDMGYPERSRNPGSGA